MAEYAEIAPDDGPTSGISFILPAGQQVEQRQIEGNNLGELIAAFDKVHGPAEREVVAVKRAKLTGKVL